ncbi:glycoside hydrolase family 15 protein [Micromonospora sp. WMMA1363]|uniref:glycoside hydrolase family 15 protein n=1 Tax=Micromonospora sp. WMMA1363 TaxID=3053985 RepID=UPI00259D218A|nr:glycoside hydrolase family 15 protein [Micromonospora sp. WMMA1363]MDM4719294.1 glycoside hydrolase family 15 protein [Micromonospora sp. WMMA1363]
MNAGAEEKTGKEEWTAETPPAVLREYALLADGYRGALIGPHGDVGWLCAPGWSDPAVFNALLGGAGRYSVGPATTRFSWGGYYEPGSLVWRSRWVTGDGIIESREALVFPGDADRLVLLRRVHSLGRPARVHVELDPRAEFGRERVRNVVRHGTQVLAQTGGLHLRFHGGTDLRDDPDGFLIGELDLPAGARHDLVLELSATPLQAPCEAPDELWRITEQSWSTTIPSLAGPAERDATLAYAVLRGMTQSGCGMVAAVTTALPERALAGRNYDYRYAWIRDQSFAGQAAALVGRYDLLDDAVTFLTERVLADGDRLAPAYTVHGAPVPREQPLRYPPGYPGAHVRTGNWVREQFQLDAYGEVLLLLAAAQRHSRLSRDSHHAMEVAVTAIERRWSEPDSGIWELPPQQWTHSKLTCVAGLRAAARGVTAGLAGRWSALADRILADAAAHGLHPAGHWQRAYDDGRVDSALLLPGIRGALPPHDPRTERTRQAVMAGLAADGYLYRFRPDRRPLGDAEGAFLLCGFAAALAAWQAGDTVGANRWFERNRAACGPPGLYTEEYDVQQRQLRGNLPQGFVHALMLETAVTLGQVTPCG